MPITFSVPDLRPCSCPPPRSRLVIARPGRTRSAPTPAGPPILWADRLAKSRPDPAKSRCCLPSACTISLCTATPADFASATISSTGWITPVSLFAVITDTRVRGLAASSRLSSISPSAARSTRPSESTGMRFASGAACITESCSTALVMIVSNIDRARLLASVPPLVKTRSAPRQPASIAISARASSTIIRAARP